MTHPALDRAVLSSGPAQIAQPTETYDSKTDQTAQSDQRFGNAGEFSAPLDQKPTGLPPKLTSGTAQRSNPGVQVAGARIDSTHAPLERRRAAAMSALPLIEAVRRVGGAIALQGDRLRLSAVEPLPENLLQELRLHKAEVIDHLQRARQLGGRAGCSGGAQKPSIIAHRARRGLERRCGPPWRDAVNSHMLTDNLGGVLEDQLERQITQQILREARIEERVAAALREIRLPPPEDLEVLVNHTLADEPATSWRAAVAQLADQLCAAQRRPNAPPERGA